MTQIRPINLVKFSAPGLNRLFVGPMTKLGPSGDKFQSVRTDVPVFGDLPQALSYQYVSFAAYFLSDPLEPVSPMPASVSISFE